MSDYNNPYSNNPYLNPYSAPPVLEADPVGRYSEWQKVEPASRGLRLANLMIDRVAQVGLVYGLAYVVGLTFGAAGLDFLARFSFLIGVAVALGYYIVLEAATGQTLGKLITGTKVVDERGGTPSFGQIVGRTFSRFIPFEPFSFLGGEGRGWHDKLPGTYVIKSRMS